ncbi:MAG: acyl-CoA thioesterase [Bacteroidota bacterium]
MKLRAKRVTESATTMSEMIMPNDTNPLGNLMGGNLLRWMDIAAAICAGKHCEENVVTASVDQVSFQSPINLGDVITIKSSITRAFNTSLETYVEVFAADIKGGNPRRCNDAYYTFVAINEETRRPVPVPPVIPLTKEEQNLYEGAAHRRELRLLISGRLKIEKATGLRAMFEAAQP